MGEVDPDREAHPQIRKLALARRKDGVKPEAPARPGEIAASNAQPRAVDDLTRRVDLEAPFGQQGRAPADLFADTDRCKDTVELGTVVNDHRDAHLGLDEPWSVAPRGIEGETDGRFSEERSTIRNPVQPAQQFPLPWVELPGGRREPHRQRGGDREVPSAECVARAQPQVSQR